MATRSAIACTRSSTELDPIHSLQKITYPKEKVGANPPDDNSALRASRELYGKGRVEANRHKAGFMAQTRGLIEEVLIHPSPPASTAGACQTSNSIFIRSRTSLIGLATP